MIPSVKFLLVICGQCIALAVELGVTEVEADVDCDHSEVENVEEESEEEDEAVGGVGQLGKCGLEDLSDDSKAIADENEHLEEKAFAFCGAGNVRFSDRKRPRKTEAENCERLKQLCKKMPIHSI